MASPIAEIIADLIQARRCPAWSIVVPLADKCTHIGRLPAGVARTAKEAARVYAVRHPILWFAWRRIRATEVR
jgi:hypothetical protein